MHFPKSINQNVMPATAGINEKGNFEVGGCDALDLASEFGTPLYVFDEKTLRKSCREYQDAFSFYKDTLILYASKALMTGAVVRIMEEEGMGLDLVSGGEIYTAYKFGFPMEKTLFNGNNKSADEIDLALKTGVGRIGADNPDQLRLIEERAKAAQKKASVALRITPGIECHTHEYIRTGQIDSKFGFDVSQLDDAFEYVKNEAQYIDVTAIHAHIGSQVFELEVYRDLVEILLNLAKEIRAEHGIEIKEVNLGGGLGIKYISGEHPPSIYEYADVIKSALEDMEEGYGAPMPRILLEPGRSIVGTSGVTLYEVGSVKQVPDGPRYVSVNGGMADNPRPAMYQAKYHAVIANRPSEKSTNYVHVAGKFCESGDVLIKSIKLPKMERGDILCVFNTGAYNYSMASNYNRIPRPAAVIVNEGSADLIIRRETYEDLISHDLIPDRLK